MKKLVLAAFVAASLFSCSKKEEAAPAPAPVSASEANTLLTNDPAGFESDFSALNSDPGTEALNSLNGLNMSGIFGRVGTIESEEQFVGLVSTTAKSVFGSTTAKPDFAKAVGTHTYNFTTKSFDKVAGGSVVIVKFPAKKSGTTNNATMTISKAEFGEFVTSKGPDYPLTRLLAELVIDGAKAASLDLTASYAVEGSSVNPVSLSFDGSVGKFVMKIGYTKASMLYKSNVHMTYDNRNMLHYDITVDMYKKAGKTSEDPAKLAGFYAVRDLKIGGYADMKGIESDPSTKDTTFASQEALFNKYVSMSVYKYSTNGLVGVLVLDKTTRKPMIKLNDGTLKDAEKVMAAMSKPLNGLAGILN